MFLSRGKETFVFTACRTRMEPLFCGLEAFTGGRTAFKAQSK